MNILAIDPGTRHLGYALVADTGEPRMAGALTLPKTLRADYDLSAVVDWYLTKLRAVCDCAADVCEEAYVEGMVARHGDPDDLLAIQAVGGALMGYLGDGIRRFWMTPNQWKAQTPKAVQHAQMKEWMQARSEGGVTYWGRLQLCLGDSGTVAKDHEHAYDAMGLALAALGLCGNKLAMAQWRALRARSPLHTSIPAMQPAAKAARAARTAKPAFVRKALTRAAKKK